MELAAERKHPGDRGLRAGVSRRSTTAGWSGRIGAIGCFSLQQGKHITTGEGGLVVTNDDALARRMYALRQQGLGLRRHEPGSLLPRPELPHERAAGRGGASPSSTSSDGVVRARVAMARAARRRARGTSGRRDPLGDAERRTRYWRYCLRVDGDVVRGRRAGARRKPRRSRGIAAHPATSRSPRSSARCSGNSGRSATVASHSRSRGRRLLNYEPRTFSRRLRRHSTASWSCRGTNATPSSTSIIIADRIHDRRVGTCRGRHGL